MPPPALRCLRANNASAMTLDGTRTYLVGGGRPLVIDPGPAEESHLEALREALGSEAPLAILLTHGHADHAGGAQALSRLTGAPVWMGAGGGGPPSGRGTVARWLEDGEALRLGDDRVAVVATPGHAPEHLCFHWTGPGAPAGGALFVGDLFLGEGETTLVAAPEGDVAAYLESLRRVEAVAPRVLYPGHGEPLWDPVATVERYRAHRQERIVQVVAALRRDPRASARDLVAAVYGRALPQELERAAEGSIRAILDHITTNPME